jgi:hypothetical protein
MLRITIELIPFGVEANKKTISELVVGNTGVKNERDEHIYNVYGWVEHEPTGNYLLDDRFQKEEFKGKVSHNRENGVFVLLYNIINRILIPRKQKGQLYAK